GQLPVDPEPSSSSSRRAPPAGSGARYDPTNPMVAQLHLQAAGVQNIRALVSVLLDPASSSYGRWRDQVLITLRRYALDDHVLVDSPIETRDVTWLRLDSVALSWIFGTISLDLQDLVRTHGGTARQAWVALEGQFLGNVEYRALQLDATFRTFVQGDLSVGEYCRRMKSMANALHDLGDLVSDRVFVLNVLRGLSSTYDHLKGWIARQRPFPTFLQVRDDLALEEITRGLAPGSSSPTPAALVATPPTSSTVPPSVGQTGGGGGRGRRRRRGGGGGTGGPASGNTGTGGGRRGGAPTPAPAPAPAPAAGGTPWPSFSNPWSGRISMWPFQGPGGGPRPQLQPAAMFTGAAPLFAPSWTPPAQPSQQPTWPGGWDQAALAQSFSTMGLTPPTRTAWIADSGASFHTTPDAGILSSIRPPHPSCPSSIMVGDGSCLPVTAVGSTPGSFRLPNVLVAPQMVYNLLFVRQFTADNSCSIEFDSSGLTVKDSASRRSLLRCGSTGPLYTLRLPSFRCTTFAFFFVCRLCRDAIFYHLTPPFW